MSEAAFWAWMRSMLRNKSRHWKPLTQAKVLVRRKYTGTNPRLKWEYQCKVCKLYFEEKNIDVDHIVPAGSLNSSDDLKGFVDRLFCEVVGLQVLCKDCHYDKSMLDKVNNKKQKG